MRKALHSFLYRLLWAATLVCSLLVVGTISWRKASGRRNQTTHMADGAAKTAQAPFRHLRAEREATLTPVRSSEEYFRALVEQSPAIIYRGEWVGYPQLAYITPNVYYTFGYQAQELLAPATTPAPFYATEDISRFFEAMQLSQAVGHGQIEQRLLHKNGSCRWVLNQWQFLPNSNQYVGYLLDVTKRKGMEKAFAHSRSKLRKLTTRLNAIHEEERLYLAREVHDVLGQNLAVLKIRLEQLLYDLPEGHNTFGEKVGKLTQLVDHTVEHVQRLTARLRPLILDELGLTAAIESLVNEFADQATFTVDLDLPDQPPVLDRDLTIALYRIVQEALTNVARHAKASHIQILFQQTADEVQLTIQDDGCGFNKDLMRSTKSLGIIGMTERVAPWNGTLQIQSAPQQGTTVQVSVPYLQQLPSKAALANEAKPFFYALPPLPCEDSY
ncbi:MAG: PAS domain-containing protein [Caldilineaceae bacterium]|nr:PAS domain-containing protein [Caldilineaceae bacterium]